MIEIILIIITICAAAYASYLFGLNQMKSKWLIEGKRQRNRLTRSLETWQNAYVKAKGGELKPKPPREPSDTKPKRIVSASEVVSELQQKKVPEILTERVPKAIEKEFLAEAKKFT